MKIVFFGSDDFALTNLERLCNDGLTVAACVTQPDRAKGRGMKVVFSVIKEFALDNGLPLLQPDNITDEQFLKDLEGLEADLFVVIAYGKILPDRVLGIPKLFCVNVHGSLLPKYRGAAPINWAIINGDTSTGVSIIQMNSKMDAGDVIAQKEILITPEDTSVTLRAKMAKESAELLVETIRAIESKKFKAKAQKDKAATLAPKLTKDLGNINWRKSAAEIHNQVRGLLPWPAAQTSLNGKKLKILATSLLDSSNEQAQPGEVVSVSKEGLEVATGKGVLLLKQVHPESSKAMDAQSFAAGHQVTAGLKFG